MRDLIWRIQHWWEYRWFRRNQNRLRNVAAWAVQHQSSGGSHDRPSILGGSADRRIKEAADGFIESRQYVGLAVK